MSPASMNGANLWANQISASSAQRTLRANAVTALGGSPSGAMPVSGAGGLFADLVSALSGQAVTINGSANGSTPAGASSGPSSGTVSGSQIAQDLQAFGQSLFQARASNPPAQAQSGSAGSASSNADVGRVGIVSRRGAATATGMGACVANSSH